MPDQLTRPIAVATWLSLLVSCRPMETTSSIPEEPARSAHVESESPDRGRNPFELPAEPAIQVHPGDDLQALLDRAAQLGIRTVIVHAGTYRPPEPRQALIWFNKRHDGLHVRAEGDVTLTAANEELADREAASYPAIVNHVVYFGDGIGPETRFSGFKITGANDFVTTRLGPVIEPTSDVEQLTKSGFFYLDGGGIKVFGRSYPTLENLEIHGNYSSPCGAGISIEHRGFTDQAVVIRNCILRNNRAPLTGAALDLLDHEFGSAAVIENCLFVDNLPNCSMDKRSLKIGTWKPDQGHGAVTVFGFSTAKFIRCTFVGNRNGVDDLSESSTYENCIFWKNDAPGGWPRGSRYEIDIVNGDGVNNCFFGGGIEDLTQRIDPKTNVLDAPDPQFDRNYNPRNSVYQTESVGYLAPPERRLPKTNANQAVLHDPATDGGIDVAIRGREFNWYLNYAGRDGRFGTGDDVSTRRNLYVPASVEVRLRIDSDDYLYTFTLPNQSIKEIAVPGLTHHSRLTVASTGIYPLIGDQFCGYSHPDLIGKLIVQTPTAFMDWLEQQSH